jgi:hypothetical protein
MTVAIMTAVTTIIGTTIVTIIGTTRAIDSTRRDTTVRTAIACTIGIAVIEYL